MAARTSAFESVAWWLVSGESASAGEHELEADEVRAWERIIQRGAERDLGA